MSKKKKKRQKNRRKNDFNPKITNVHHCLWIGREWNEGHYSKELRNHWYFKVSIPRDTLHRQIHESVKRIPVPSESSCKYALEIIHDLEGRGAIRCTQSIRTRLELLICIFDCMEPETTKGLRLQLDIINKFYKQQATR